jgi:hypothetical protein
MTRILTETVVLFSLISGAFYQYKYDKPALIFLCLAVSLALATLFSIRNDINKTKDKEKIKTQEFKFVDPPGYYTHPKYEHPVCPSCLHKIPHKISPVSRSGNGWICMVCGKTGGEGDMFVIPDEIA